MSIKLVLDLDGTITHYPKFFAQLSKFWGRTGIVVVLTSRGQMWEEYIRRDLTRYGIHFDFLKVHPQETTPMCEESRRWKKEELEKLTPCVWFDDDPHAEAPEGATKILVD